MKFRNLGNSNKKVSEIGLGAWQLGNTNHWNGVPESKAEEFIDKALELGVNFFDTAPNYAEGKSEELLGKTLAGKRKDVIISTKFGHFANDTRSFDSELLQGSIENSLKKLKTDYLDCVLLHNPSFDLLSPQNTSLYSQLAKLKEEGVIHAYGVSIDTSKEIDKLLAETDIDAIEIMYNIIYQEPIEAMQKAYDKGVGVIVKVPLDSGWLSGKYNKNSKFDKVRDRWSKEVIEKRASLVSKIDSIKSENTSMIQEALRFVLANECVSTVIPGPRTIEQLIENCTAGNEELPIENYKKYTELYKNEIGGNPLPW